ncbi:hypothetical protein V2I01_25435 [Micromonospora sp. BRA006-A]|nr:hypothetical protein [Micromonospora sp. BRA006-A]
MGNASASSSPARWPRSGLLLLDEPTNHLDIGHQLQLLHPVRRSQVTALAALHDLNLAVMFCDTVVVLHHGRVVAAGPPARCSPGAARRRVRRRRRRAGSRRADRH